MKTGTCKHFTGIQHSECKAGVNYRALVGGPDFGWATRLPCFKEKRFEVKGGEYAACDRREEPSAEEIAQYEAELEQHWQRVEQVIPLINRIKKEHKRQSWRGIEACPICDGQLHLSHAALNGHVWGKCETEGCVSWME